MFHKKIETHEGIKKKRFFLECMYNWVSGLWMGIHFCALQFLLIVFFIKTKILLLSLALDANHRGGRGVAELLANKSECYSMQGLFNF